MKIIHFFNELKFSGAEIMYVSAAPYFQNMGCELSAVATGNAVGDYESEFKKAGFEIFHKPLPSNLLKRAVYYFRLISFLKKNGYQTVHIHRSQIFFGISLCAKLADCNCVYTYHNVFRSNIYSYPLHYFKRLVAKNILGCRMQTISDSVYFHESDYYHNKTNLVYNWYDKNKFYPGDFSEKHHQRQILGIDDSQYVIISVGGCSSIKRHSDIIRALAIISDKIPNITYLHLGEGDMLNEEMQLANKLNIQDKIRFCGNSTDVRSFLIASDLYIMTSKFEGISLTTIEALACRIPALLYNVPGLKDFNNENECAVIIQEDITLLAQYISDILFKKMSVTDNIVNGEALVHKKYDIAKNSQQIFYLYN